MVRQQYSRVSREERIDEESSGEVNRDIPADPPAYDAAEMDFEDLEPERVSFPSKLKQWRDSIQSQIVYPMRVRVMDPVVQMWRMMFDKIDYYLSKVGNPLILSRFIYMILMSLIVLLIWRSGLLPNNKARGENGKFSDHRILLDYAKKSIDLSKLEKDWEYLSSMPHLSGTKGDTAICDFIMKTFKNNGVKMVEEYHYETFMNYPGVPTLSINDGGETIDFQLSEENFNPYSPNGNIDSARLVNGGKGSLKELESLRSQGLLEDDYILLIEYGNVVSEQILAAEKFGAKAVIFISESWNGKDDIVQKKSVALPQYSTGNPKDGGWFTEKKVLEPKEMIPKIPSIPISKEQGNQLFNFLSDNKKSRDTVRVNLHVNNSIRDAHPATDIVAKLDGSEQSGRAIILLASRTSIDQGAMYPNSGTATMLSILQLMQELRFKFNWEPLRSIYFISVGATEYNYAGATELMKDKYQSIIEGVYNVIDVSELGLWDMSKEIDVETHPFFFELFGAIDSQQDFKLEVKHVEHYGDWVPFMAAGIPVTVLSTKGIISNSNLIYSKEDTFANFKDSFTAAAKSGAIDDMLLFLLNVVLKVIDSPLLPINLHPYVDFIVKDLDTINAENNGVLNLQPVMQGLSNWREIARQWLEGVKSWEEVVLEHDGGFEPTLIYLDRTSWNTQIANAARYLVSWKGVPNRSFYRNLFLGPEYWTQLDEARKSWTMPGLRDLLHEGKIEEANNHLSEMGRVLEEGSHMFVDNS
ncbi:Tre1p [Nakaseomyces bracarensis]|uniref:Tre1p n=1 Tax=Nakaseomyces bracarensis TaxID=273131 RepID=UPI0038713CE2